MACADHAKVREIAAHRRAITLQEVAAVRFDLLGLEVYAATARGRAVRARESLQAALGEQAEASAYRLRWLDGTATAPRPAV